MNLKSIFMDKVLKGSSSQVLLRGSTLVINLVAHSFLISNTGVKDYGLFSAILTVILLVGLIDLGIGNAMIGSMASINIRSTIDVESERTELVASAFKVTIISGICFTIIFGAIVASLEVTKPRDFELLNMFNSMGSLEMILFVSLFLSPVIGLPAKILVGLQDYIGALKLNFILSVFPIIASLIISYYVSNVWFITGTYILVQNCIGVSIAISLLKRFRVTPMALLVNNGKSMELLKKGRLFQILQVGSFLLTQMNTLFVILMADASSAGVAATLTRFSLPIIVVFSIVFLPTWPQQSMLRVFGEHQAAKDLIFEGIKKALKIGLIFGIAYILFLEEAIRIWSHGSIAITLNMAVVVALFVFVSLVSQPINMSLNGIHAEKFLIVSTLTSILLTGAITLYLAPKFAITGYLIASSLTQIINIFAGLAYMRYFLLRKAE